ncbi:DUF2726 domain-containing protein [Actinomyces sp. Z3]|nr:DUF2726 domain-containing protein [Actinomyces sp. Z3]
MRAYRASRRVRRPSVNPEFLDLREIVVDLRETMILIRAKNDDGATYEDKTSSIVARWRQGEATIVQFAGSGKEYGYLDKYDRLRELSRVGSRIIDEESIVIAKGDVVHGVNEVVWFSDGSQKYARLFMRKKDGGERCQTYPSEAVQVIDSATRVPFASAIMSHWRSVVSSLKADDPLMRSYGSFKFIHPSSALACYLEGVKFEVTSDNWKSSRVGRGTEPLQNAAETIVPFDSNLSQQDALRRALRSRVSVIEGPPGTGKTETILNIVANIVADGKSVGVVSFNNAAVENVSEKLTRFGLGFVAADLGRKSKRDAFFARQGELCTQIAEYLSSPLPPRPVDGEISALDAYLNALFESSRGLAQDQSQLAALELERQHFEQLAAAQRLPDLKSLPLLHKSADRILDYLVENGNVLPGEGRVRKLGRLVRNYFRYGPTKSIDPGDADTVIAIERGWYRAKVEEIRRRVTTAQAELERADFLGLQARRKELSQAALRHALQGRYGTRRPREFSPDTYRRKGEFRQFIHQHPVILSTCHSLRACLPEGFLLDYLIVDESSQVGLLPAALALSCARQVVVVGDLKQLPDILPDVSEERVSPAPSPAYDPRSHSLLSSVIAVFGESVPRTLLREHYRCDPDIIGFCNAMFYDDQLISMPTGARWKEPLMLIRLAEGNHMRHYRSGGNSSQREAEVIAREILAPLPMEARDGGHIGVITPYRRQVDKITRAIAEQTSVQVEYANQPRADTVHKFQGREKDIIVLSPVVDDSRDGHRATPFADDPHLINVAVSRARRRFVLVIDSSFLPRSKNLRSLAGWMRYHRPVPEDEYTQSKVLSVFDLLYSEYSDRLRGLRSRVTLRSRYLSENIIWTVLDELLAEDKYSRLHLASQVPLKEVLGPGAELTEEEREYIRRASFDFVLGDSITKEVLLAIEVDGFAYHEDDPRQTARDELKNAVCDRNGIALLRLPTTGSDEREKLRQALDAVLPG